MIAVRRHATLATIGYLAAEQDYAIEYGHLMTRYSGHSASTPPDEARHSARLVIRHPTPDDHSRVLEGLEGWWGGFGGEAGALQRALLVPRLFLQHFADTSYLVEDQDGRLVAFLIGFLSQSRPHIAYIHFVAVNPTFHGKQIGRWLYTQFFSAAAGRGATEVHCITSPGNHASRAFHTRLGFEVDPSATRLDGVDVHLDYDGPDLHRVCFTRRLV